MEFLIRMGKILDNTHKFYFSPYMIGFIHTTICNDWYQLSLSQLCVGI